MTAVTRVFPKFFKLVPVEVYPLVGMVSIACGFGVYTSVKNTRKNTAATQDMSQTLGARNVRH